ncbi:MAG: ROK family protein [SAR324 cluster bacterium]|nr:ROK family protein [SAR324 cluster bacterium]
MKLIGIDLGGSKIEVVAINDNPKNILFTKRIPTHKEKGYPHIIKSIKLLYRQASKAINESAPLGIGIPGSISLQTGLVRNANLQILNDQPLKKDIEIALGMKVSISNDANCLGLSECYFGSARNYRTVLAIIMGTGMGGAVIIDNQLVVGLNGIAGEIGHLSIDSKGKQCWCGNKGCMELYLSGTGLENIYFDYQGVAKKADQIYQSYLNKELNAILSIQKFLDLFGRGMANLCSAIDPDIIVIGGGLSKLDILYHEGFLNMKDKLLDSSFYPKIVASQLGDASGVFGAAALNYIK